MSPEVGHDLTELYERDDIISCSSLGVGFFIAENVAVHSSDMCAMVLPCHRNAWICGGTCGEWRSRVPVDWPHPYTESLQWSSTATDLSDVRYHGGWEKEWHVKETLHKINKYEALLLYWIFQLCFANQTKEYFCFWLFYTVPYCTKRKTWNN